MTGLLGMWLIQAIPNGFFWQPLPGDTGEGRAKRLSYDATSPKNLPGIVRDEGFAEPARDFGNL